jgi:hypothetical protein
VPDGVVRVLSTHVSVVQQRATDDFQALASADDLRAIAHAVG